MFGQCRGSDWQYLVLAVIGQVELFHRDKRSVQSQDYLPEAVCF